MTRRTAWIAGTAVLVIACAAVTVWLLTSRSGSAEEQALAYLHALEDRDLTAVEALGVEVSAETASAFASASDHLSDAHVGSSTESGSARIVHVVYSLGGDEFKNELTMIEQSGRWVPEAATALGTIRITAGQIDAPVRIGEAVLSTGAAVALLPAEYELTVSPKKFLDGSAAVQVQPGSDQDVTIDVALRPEAAELAQPQLDEYLKTCTHPSAEVPASCGIVIPWPADFVAVSDISYRVENLPTISLTPTSFQAGGGALVATVTGTAIDGSSSTLSYRTTSWAVRGAVAFTADDIVLSVW